jgi:thiol:disulfide interchange protein
MLGAITCCNAANGKVISNFATMGLIEASAALWHDMVFIGHSNFNIYAFGKEPSIPVTVAAGTTSPTVAPGSTVTISVRTFVQHDYTDAYGNVIPYYPPIRDAPVTVTIIKPDQTTETFTTTTDKSGSSSITFTASASGEYKVAADYAGLQFYGYNYAPATSESTFTATGSSSPTTPSPTATSIVPTTTSPEPTQSSETTPTATTEPSTNDYLYAIIAAVVVIIVIVAVALVYMTRRKK